MKYILILALLVGCNQKPKVVKVSKFDSLQIYLAERERQKNFIKRMLMENDSMFIAIGRDNLKYTEQDIKRIDDEMMAERVRRTTVVIRDTSKWIHGTFKTDSLFYYIDKENECYDLRAKYYKLYDSTKIEKYNVLGRKYSDLAHYYFMKCEKFWTVQSGR